MGGGSIDLRSLLLPRPADDSSPLTCRRDDASPLFASLDAGNTGNPGTPSPFVFGQTYPELLMGQAGPFQFAQYGQQVTPLGQQVTPAAPLSVDSNHCLGSSVLDLQRMFETFRGDACGITQSQLLPQIVDHGNFEIRLLAPLNPGHYRGGIVVEGETMMDARLFIENGRIRGTIDFIPHIVKENGVLDRWPATLSQIRIDTDASGNFNFTATATCLNLPIPLIGDSFPMNVTQEFSQTLFGSTGVLVNGRVPGPASRLLGIFMQAQGADSTHLENLVNMAGARFRIVANEREGDTPVPGIGRVSNAHIRLPQLDLSPTLSISDVDLNVEVWPNETTGGFSVRIPSATIAQLRHAPADSCNGAPNPGTTLSNIRMNDIVLEMAPRGDRDQLGLSMFEAQSQALRFLANFCAGQPVSPNDLSSPFYLASGSGRIQTGAGSINGDVNLLAMEGDNAVRFNVSDGQANGNMRVTIDAPRMGMDMPDGAAITLGGTMLQGRTVNAHIDDAILSNLHAELNVQDGTVHYSTRFSNSLAGATLNGNDASGTLLAGASIMGFQADLSVDGDLNLATGQGAQHLHVANASLDPRSDISATAALGLPVSGNLHNGFSGVALDATVTQENFQPTGFSLDRLTIPQYGVNGSISALGQTLGIGLANGPAAGGRPAGVALTRDTTGPTAGITSTLSLNTQTNRLRFTIPHVGTFEMSGPLTGTIGMASTSSPIPPTGAGPLFRPVAGSMRLRLNGTIRQVSGGHLRLSGPIEISDTPGGRITIRSTSGISGLPMSTSIQARSQIVADLHSEVRRNFTPRPGLTVPYYDFDPAASHDISIPSILINSALSNPALPSPIDSQIDGTARITMGPNLSSVRATYDLRMPLTDQSVPISGGTIQVVGGTGANQASVRITGVNEQVHVHVRPPQSFRIQTTQTRDGLTYEIAGTLTPTGDVDADINLRNPLRPSLRLADPANPYTLAGNVTVTVRNDQGQVVGSGQVGLTTAYRVTGTMDNGRARFSLDVPETTLTGALTQGFTTQGITIANGARLSIPIRGFHGDISVDARDLSNPRVASTWNLPSLGSGDDTPEILVPAIDIAGFEGDQGQFRNLRVNFALDPQGQQIQLDYSPNDGVRFQTLAGTNGQPRTVRLSYGVGEARQRIVITGTADTSAGVSGSVLPNGEIAINVTDLTADTRTNGQILQPLQLDLTALNTLTHIPGLQVRYNPVTNQIHLVANPPHPTLPTPPATFEEFFRWTPQQWTDYTRALDRETHMVRLSEANVAVQRALGKSIPPGRGDIFVNLTRPLDVTLTADGNLLGNLTAALDQRVNGVPLIDIRRALPSPPPCRSGTCPPVVMYSGQNPDGELFFTQVQQGTGQPALNPEIPGILQEALGVDRTRADAILRDYRISVADLIQTVRQSPGVGDHYSEADLRSLLTSYYSSPVSNGTERQMELRGLIALANVRRSLGNLMRADGGSLPVHGHVFRNDDYHTVSRGDGTDMQDLAILPVGIDAVQAIITDMAHASRWDNWVDQSAAGTSPQVTGRLLNGFPYTVTVENGTSGNVRLVHFHLVPGANSGLQAYTRTVRLVPVTNAVDPQTGQTVASGTLVMFDEHSDFNGHDYDLPFPRMRLARQPHITWEGFLNGALRAFEPPRTNVTSHALNRFAITMNNVLAIARDPSISSSALRGMLTFDSGRSEQTATVRRSDFLSLSADGTNLMIADTAQDSVVRSYLEEHLSSIPGTTLDRWLRADGTGHRQIPLEELRTASGMNQQFPADAFRALARTFLNPPAGIDDPGPTGRNFGSSTERFILTLEHIRSRAQQLRALTGDVLVFEDDRFHPNISQASRRQGDTVDSLNIYFIPQTMNWQGQSVQLNVDRFIETIHHAEYYARIDSSNFSTSDVVQNPTLANGAQVDPTRPYTHSVISLPGGLSLSYLISSMPRPLTVDGVGRLSAWRLEPSTQYSDFLDNSGWWLVVPAEGGGNWLFRCGILNSSPSGSDNTGTVAETGRRGVVHFGEELVSSTLEYQRTGNPTAWTSGTGRVFTYQVGQDVHISQ